MYYPEHVLKLSLGLLFGISNILSLGWGNSRTHLSEKRTKNEKMWLTKDLHTKNRKKKKNQEPKILVSSKKMYLSVKKIKRQIVLLFYSSCLIQGRKVGGSSMFSRNP
jgi:hypothetical protein